MTCTIYILAPGEAEAYTYNFVSAEEFEDDISKGEYLEYGNYAGAYYGTSKKVIYEKIDSRINVVLEGDLETAAQLKQQCKEAVLGFYYSAKCGRSE